MIDSFVPRAVGLGVDVALARQISEPLDKYLKLLLSWNERINITAILTVEGIVERHLLDSLAVWKHIPAAASIVDVGSGGGFPGAVLALVSPEVTVTLVEPSHKKAAFLETLKRDLHLPNLRVATQRVESLGEPHSFDVAVSRATFELPAWLDIGRRLVRAGGLVLGMEGAKQYDLPPSASRHPYDLGDQTRAIIRLECST
jgi:16S rRNA (guanine527-N7)-methyltransferase